MPVTTDITAYVSYKEKKESLMQIYQDSLNVIAPLHADNMKDYLHALLDKIDNDTFKVLVIGVFKCGKSTLINSFLGDEILPAYSIPCTAVINEVKYGEEKKAILFFKNPLPEQKSSQIPEKILKHIKSYESQVIPPIKVPYDELEDYAVIPMGKELKDNEKENIYEKIELYWPLDLLENNVEMIDSPGLSEHETRTKVTMEYVDKADAVIFVLAADRLGSQDEMEVIEKRLKRQGFEEMFFVINRINLIRSEREKERTKQFAKEKLKQFTNLGEEGLFFISALDALEGKMNCNLSQYQESGMMEFESKLASFLTDEKGRIKLLQPAKELKRVLSQEIKGRSLPQQKSILEKSLDDVKERWEEVQPRLQELRKKKDLTDEQIKRMTKQTLDQLERDLGQYYTDIMGLIDDWVSNYEPETKIDIKHPKKSLEIIAEEILTHVSGQVEENQNRWQKDHLVPFVQGEIGRILDAIEGKLDTFYLELNQLQTNFTGIEVTPESDIPTWERAAAAATGFLLTGVSGAGTGATEGFSKNFGKRVGIQFGIIVGAMVLGLFNPVFLITFIVASIAKSAFTLKGNFLANIKKTVITETKNKIAESRDQNVESMIDEIRKIFNDNFSEIIIGLEREVEEVERLAGSVLAELEQGQEEVERKKSELENCEKQASSLIQEVDEFIQKITSEGEFS